MCIVSGMIRRHLAVYGIPLPIKEATCGFIVTLRDGEQHLIYGDDSMLDILMRVREELTRHSDLCGDVIRGDELKSACDNHNVLSHNVTDHFGIYLMGWAVYNGEYRTPRQIIDFFDESAMRKMLNESPPYPFRLPSNSEESVLA